MEDRINQALLQLEKDLQSINSAREQVESTVKASTELQKVVGEYVTSVKKLCIGLKSWEGDLSSRGTALSEEFERAISQINTSCSAVIMTFNSSVDKSINEFKSKSESTIEKFTSQNTILTERVQELNKLRDEIKTATAEMQSIKEGLAQISKDLKDSQDGQDAVLNDIKQTVSEIPEMINNNAQSIIERIGSLNQGLSAEIESLQGKADNLNSELSQLKALCYDIKTATNQLNSNLQSSKESLLSAITQSKEETAKSISINRWLIIAAFIILVIVHFILK
jgi:chromosome segregation ATPase